jgi:hypothetical protein
MKRGGYDSYPTDEALEQAEERGENVGWDRLFGVAGTVGEGICLAILTASVAYLATRALLEVIPLVTGLVTTAVGAMLAPRLANWMVKAFPDSAFRRLLWGLATAATLLLFVRIVLAILLLLRLRLQGVGEAAAGVGAFHGAAHYTLMIAMPVWGLYAVWGWLRRRSLAQDRALPKWRHALPLVFVAAVMIFMGMEGAHFDGLKKS